MTHKKLTLRAVEPEDADLIIESERSVADSDYHISSYVAPLSRQMVIDYALSYQACP